MGEGFEGVRSNIGAVESVEGGEEDAGYVERDVALADDYGGVGGVEAEGAAEAGVFRKPIVPTDKGPGGVDAGEGVFARDVELAVLGGAVGEEEGVVMGGDRGEG